MDEDDDNSLPSGQLPGDLPDGGAIAEMEVDDEDVQDTADGGAFVRLDEEERTRDPDFYKNLAEEIDETSLNRLAANFLDLLEKDKDARKKRDEQYEEGLRRTGLGDDAPGGAQFEGASRVVHPMLTEVCVDFAARSIKELFPPEGPVKDLIVGDVDEKKVDKARRKTDLMNWQLTVQSPEFRAELEQLLTQVPMGGAQYLKLSWNEGRNRPNFLFVGIDEIYLPFAATNFYTSQRKTHVQYVTELEYNQRVKSGMYRDVDLTSPGEEPEQTRAEKANDKIEGRKSSSYNEDGLRTIFEIYAFAEVEEDEDAAPYILSIDKSTRKVLAIYRNWDAEDDTREELQWIVEFPFIPWRGAYPIGVTHLIGGLSAATTGALRALLDAAHISNSQTMLKLKGGTRGGQSLTIQPAQTVEIEGGLNIDDVRKLAMPLPYNPPSPVLYQLLGFLVDAGKGVVATALEKFADQNPNAPVGTTLAQIEQGMVVFSAIHARLHNSMAKVLKILHRLNGMYLDDERVEAEVGEALATRADFEGAIDVVPVSDPNIFSEAQRFAQVQAIAQRAAAMPQLYDLRKVEERVLDTLKIPNSDELLVPDTKPEHQNPVNENMAASLGRPIVAFPEQDHIAHLKAHVGFLVSPMFGMNELIAPNFLPAIIAHVREHLLLWYMTSTVSLAEEETGRTLNDIVKEHENKAQVQAFERMLAEASTIVIERSGMAFEELMGVMRQAQQMAAQFAPPMPIDPSQAQMMEIQRKQSADKQRAQLETQKMQLETQKMQMQLQAESAKLQAQQGRDMAEMQSDAAAAERTAMEGQVKAVTEAERLALAKQKAAADFELALEKQDREDARKQAELEVKLATNEADNQTALSLAEMEIESGEKFSVSTGTGINPQP